MLLSANFCSWVPDIHTAENWVNDTPLPQFNFPPFTPQLPFDDVIVKLEADPDNVNVASVCVDHVPRDKRPPSLDPKRIALIVALAGSDPEVYRTMIKTHCLSSNCTSPTYTCGRGLICFLLLMMVSSSFCGLTEVI